MAARGGAQGLNGHYENALAVPGATPPHGCATLGSNSATIGPSAQYQLGNQVAQRSPCHGYQSCSGLLRVHHHPDLVNHHSLRSGPSSRIARSCGRSLIAVPNPRTGEALAVPGTPARDDDGSSPVPAVPGGRGPPHSRFMWDALAAPAPGASVRACGPASWQCLAWASLQSVLTSDTGRQRFFFPSSLSLLVSTPSVLAYSMSSPLRMASTSRGKRASACASSSAAGAANIAGRTCAERGPRPPRSRDLP